MSPAAPLTLVSSHGTCVCIWMNYEKKICKYGMKCRILTAFCHVWVCSRHVPCLSCDSLFLCSQVSLVLSLVCVFKPSCLPFVLVHSCFGFEFHVMFDFVIQIKLHLGFQMCYQWIPFVFISICDHGSKISK